jgi:hypothetical protein
MHEGSFTQRSDEQMAQLLEERIAAITLPAEIQVIGEGFALGDKIVMAPNPEYLEKVKYETERAQEGWDASCTCGWLANNPLASEEDAKEALAEHYDQIASALKGLEAENV